MSPELKGLLLVASLKVLGLFVALLVGVIMVVWVERRGSALLQDRLGPNRVGPLGLLQNVADGLKNFIKEEVVPHEADKILFQLAPLLSFIPAFLMFAVIPYAAPLPGFDITLPVLGRFVYEGPVAMVVADLPVGFLFIIAFSSLAVYGITLAGWAANSKYALLGGLRASAQMISYELAIGLSLVVVLLLAGNVSLGEVIAFQQRTTWFVFAATIAYMTFHIGAFAETNRLPFDLPEAEAELVAGYHAEYSAMKYAIYPLSEYAALITMSAFIATLFFGGWDIPFTRWDEQVATAWSAEAVVRFALTNLAFLLKTFFFIWVFVWVRWTLPRFRYDQLMFLGWKVLLPLSLVYIVIMATAVLLLERAGVPHTGRYGLWLFLVNVPLVVALVWGLDRRRVLAGTVRRVRVEA
ncbi:MAG: NADH-quinone oxidoreductase subunit NuoH [Gemmatimonadota bacterium]|nr:NADH-quinone oxidoreductase subunit NuoH [Gemmatimonadota bacterium]MDH4350741.1 NADH-quinone oxidoreductase subunit NuoH [Gemmatimonadota bacterium]